MRDADAWMYSQGGEHTGAYQRRVDAAPLSGQDPGPCQTSPYGPNSIYYPMTMLITLGSGLWVETIDLGTGHGCQGQRYWYWAYRVNNVWRHIDAEWNIPLRENYFDIHRLRDGYWRWDVNGVNKYTMGWNTNARDVSYGYESYNSAAETPWVTYDLLQKTMNDGPWVNLNGSLFGEGPCAVKISSNAFQQRQAPGC